MRALVAVVLIVLAAAAPARAADLVEAPDDFSGEVQYDAGGFAGVRAEPVLIYDYQPGVIVRSWWLSPWHQRHYFPTTGVKPKVGRRENLAARYKPVPAQAFYRAWSTNSLFIDLPPLRAVAIDDEGIPRRRKAPAKP
jgi:hypothetical protein